MEKKTWGSQRGGVTLIALMVMALLSLLGISALTTAETELKIARNRETALRALFLAEAGLQHAAGVFSRQGFAEAVELAGENHPLEGGSYRMELELLASSPLESRIRVRSTGAFREATRQIEAEYLRRTPSFEPSGAVNIFGASPRIAFGAGGSGRTFVDGRDYAIPFDFECTGASCDGMLSLGTPLAGLYTTDAAVIEGEGLAGEPVVKQGGAPVEAADWRYAAEKLRATAETDLSDLGSREAPRIVLVEQNHDFTGNGSGAGILIVGPGAEVNFAGTFHYEGVILVMEGGRVDMATGTVDLYGTLVVLGDEAEVELNGNSRVRYSSEALLDALGWLNSAGAPGTRLISWRDLSFPES